MGGLFGRQLERTIERMADLARFWEHLVEGTIDRILVKDGGWDDPLFDRKGPSALAPWVRNKDVRGVKPLRVTADDRRVAVEHVLDLKDGLMWNEREARAEKADRFELATAVVGDRAGDSFSAIRVYFGTWAVNDGKARIRKGPICPDERERTRAEMDRHGVVRTYFDKLAVADLSILDLFEPDGYFREPANNFVCGKAQLEPHFRAVLSSGGVGIEFLTAIHEKGRIGLELQTVLWGKKKMDVPQAGFAIYELGPNGKLSGSRVYDSAVPPE